MKREMGERRGRGREWSLLPAAPDRESDMTGITFKRIARHEWRVYQDGDIVGDVLRMPDILKRGAMLFVIHLDEDFRGPVRVHDCNRVREVTEQMVRTHPFHG